MTPRNENAPAEGTAGAHGTAAASEVKDSTALRTVSAPDELRSLPGWLVWRSVPDPKRPGKARKVPYYARTGRRRNGTQGAPEDRAQLTTFDEAIQVVEAGQFDGVGLALMPEFSIVALDFDDCVKGGVVDPSVVELVGGTYAEFSPSGRGVRAFMVGDLGNRKAPVTAEAYGFETFSSKGFVTVTGSLLPATELLGNENTLAPVTEAVRQLCAVRFGPSREAPAAEPIALPGADLGRLQHLLSVIPAACAEHYDDWLRVGMALHHETEGSDAGLEVWDAWSQQAPNYQGREDLARRWAGFGRGSAAPVTISTLERFAGPAASLDDFESLDAEEARQRRPRSASEILAREFEPLRWVVPRVLPEGVFLLVASPKIGKSWLALQIALAVAAGGEVLGEKASRGAALYLALEDNDRRLQSRLKALDADLMLSAASGDALQFETDWPRVDAGGEKAIEAWLGEHTEARLVVVDVLERFRPMRKAKGNLYAEDYAALRALKAIADTRRISILVVHHTRKGATDDPMEMVSGTQGLAGSADGMLMLERARGEARGKLHVIGRDIEDDGEYVVEFAGCRWSMLGSARSVAPTMERQEALDVLKNAGGPLSAQEVAEALGKKRSAVARLLTKLVTDGVTTKVGSKYEPAVAE